MTDPCKHEDDFATLRVGLAIHDEWRRGVDEKLDLILAQTTATNGRVRTLEDWRNRQAGAVAVVGALTSVVGGGVVALIDYLRR